jgi:hypothetical protein
METKDRDSKQPYCKVKLPETLMSLATMAALKNVDFVIEQKSLMTLIGHFPVLILILIPLLVWRNCHEFGRYGISTREVFILSFSIAEYLSGLFIFIKGIICYNHISLKTQLIAEYDFVQDKPLMKNITTTDDGLVVP